ncbi:MAG: type II secretion system protein GspF [Gammaproteobacteria bacterium]|nr:MAG: type II secretion system protein GspF [Gammaproteobacteria bacterium]
MSAFEFTALDDQGRKQRGVLEGDTARQIRQILRDRHWSPLSVEEVTQSKTSSGPKLRRGPRIGAADLALLTRQFATLISAALPVDEALHALSRQTNKGRIKAILIAVRSQVMEGYSLARAMEQYPSVFNETYRTTIEAGEASGKLAIVLERLADYVEEKQALQQKMIQAMIYPVILTLVALGVISLLMLYVVPDVIQVFTHMNQTLPILTRILIQVSHFLQAYIGLLLLGLGGVLLGIVLLLRQPAIRYQFHRLLLKLPVIGPLVLANNTARFSRTFHVLLSSGIPAMEALKAAARTIANLPMRRVVDEAAQRVKEGSSLHKALDRGGYFPPLLIHLIASGEASGRLDQMLQRAAQSQEDALENRLSTLMALLEPLMILIMGFIVLLIVLSILLPIMDMNQIIK